MGRSQWHTADPCGGAKTFLTYLLKVAGMRISKIAVAKCLALVVVFPLAGCQLAPMPGNLLGSVVPGGHDRAIAEHAAKSSFPSPADVGMASSDEPAPRR